MMTKITAEELKTILENHEHWLKRDCAGWEKMRADLVEADLEGIDLRYADLHGANLTGANLTGANLTGANLSYSNLSDATLTVAILDGADLRFADMQFAWLYGAALHKADMLCATLYRATLSYATLAEAMLHKANVSLANLHCADLCEADLSCAHLYGSNLCGSNLDKAVLTNANILNANFLMAKNVPYIPMACPEEGSFIGWKKANGKIVCLEIPEDAKRSSATSRKCRCNKSKVLSITYINGDSCELKEVASDYDSSFLYKIGETVTVDNFDENRWNTCSKGIHFFINRMEAVQYNG